MFVVYIALRMLKVTTAKLDFDRNYKNGTGDMLHNASSLEPKEFKNVFKFDL
jgi:hypothetical protein